MNKQLIFLLKIIINRGLALHYLLNTKIFFFFFLFFDVNTKSFTPKKAIKKNYGCEMEINNRDSVCGGNDNGIGKCQRR